MKVRNSLEKRMRGMHFSGRGIFYDGAKEGEVLFSTSIEGGRLDVYFDGFYFFGGKSARRVYFSEVSSIESNLSAKIMSAVIHSGDSDFYLLLNVRCGEESIPLSLPFLSYSDVMNILTGLGGDWLKSSCG